MKTRILVTAAVLATMPALAQEAAPAAPAAPAVSAAETAPAATAEQYEAAARNLMNCIKELDTTLQGVKDTASADAAAPKVKELVEKMNAVSAENEKLGEPTPEIQQKVEQAIGAEFQQTMESLGNTLKPIAMNGFYDSEAFTAAIMPLLYGGVQQ